MDCSCNHHHDKKENYFNYKLVLNIIGIIILIITLIIKPNDNLNLILYLLSYILIGFEIIFNALKGLFKKQLFDENFLMFIATIGAFCIGEYLEGIAVLIFFQIGEFLQDLAINNSRKRIKNALNLKPEFANLKINNNIKIINPNELKPNDIIIVKTGEKVPVDGIIIKGNTSLDVKTITGESLPKEVQTKDNILSGSINIGSLIEVKVTKNFENSFIYQMIELIENANNNKSDTEKFITKFAKIYTPIVILIAIIIAIFPPLLFDYNFNEYLRRALIFLVISCPCALVLSIPLGYFAGIGSCSKKGILVKGSNYLDQLIDVKTIIFDKTGTLTKGNFNVSKVVSINKNNDEVLKYIALCESFSNHPIAKSIINYYKGKLDKKLVTNHEELSGFGIKAKINNKEVLVGNDKLLDKYQIKYDQNNEIGTIVYLAINQKYQGYLVIADEIKEDSIKTINLLKQLDINNLIMLTGDNELIAKNVANKLNLSTYYAGLLPQDKVNILEKIKKKAPETKIAFIGDGINDSIVLAASDIGISMASGADIATQSADIVLLTNEPSKIVDTIKIAKKTRKIVLQNIFFAISIKILFLILSGLGLTQMWLAIFADVGVSLIVVLNSTRIMKYK